MSMATEHDRYEIVSYDHGEPDIWDYVEERWLTPEEQQAWIEGRERP
jgi:hypothetical protein